MLDLPPGAEGNAVSELAYLTGQLLNGLVLGTIYFLAAAGLSLVFGVTEVANFAHGGLYMLGAYVGTTLVAVSGSFWLALVIAPVLVGVLAAGTERTTLRCIYDRDPNFQIILTYGLLLCINAIVVATWGRGYQSLSTPAGLAGPIDLGPLGAFPRYRLFVFGAGIAVSALLWVVVERTDFGLVLRASVQNKDSLELLGIDTAKQYTRVFAIGAMLAALAGVLVAPFLSVYPAMGNDIIISLFVIVVLGGLGSVRGSFVAALCIGVVEVFGNLYAPELTGVLLYLVTIVVLLVRPTGLYGEYEVSTSAAKISLGTLLEPISLADRRSLLVLATLAAVPLGTGLLYSSYYVGLLALVFVWGIFAISLDIVMGYVGVVSFGHALFFGLGAYVTALVVTHIHTSLVLAAVASVSVTAVVGWALGELSNRLGGVYFAIVTLSVAELAHRAVFVLDGVTGGSNGFTGMPDPTLLGVVVTDAVWFYYLSLAVLVGVYAVVRHLVGSPFGRVVVAIRESEGRARSLGCDVRRVKRRMFGISGALAGLAGALLAAHQTFVSPDVLHWLTSGNVVALTLFGGIGSLFGPLVGAGVFIGLSEILASHFSEWRLLFGGLVVGTIVISPRGAVRLPHVLARLSEGHVDGIVRALRRRTGTARQGEGE